jgi:hypothetical protein
MALRDMALLHVAIYDTIIAAWDSKYAYNRQRPRSRSGLPSYSMTLKSDHRSCA